MNSPAQPLRRTLTLKTRIVIGFVILSTITLAAAFGISYFNLRRELRNALKQRLINIATLAAMQQDGDAFTRIQSASDPEFIESYTQNTAILNSEPDLAYLYTMRYDEQGIYFVVDAGDPNDPGHADYGERYQEPGPALAANYRNLQESIVEEGFYTDEFGTFLTAYAPIRSSSNEIVGIIGADIRAEKILASERKLLLSSIMLYLLILPAIVAGGIILGNVLIGPIQALTQMADRFRAGELTYRIPITTRAPEVLTLYHAFDAMASQLQDLIRSLEGKVEERTRELRIANEQIQRRIIQLQTIEEIGYSILQIKDLEQLLASIANLISERFGFYHIGVFLADKKNEYMVLKASNSEGGARMIARHHRLRIGKEGIVGYVADRGKPRIALDVGVDAVYFNNPDLPATRSEMALPLVIQGHVIGVLDIQSSETNAFHEEDFAIFNALANQVAIAIENARLLEENRRAIQQTEQLYSRLVLTGWSRILESKAISGVHYTPQTGPILIKKSPSPAASSMPSDASGSRTSALSLPITLRGQTIGNLEIRLPQQRNLSPAEITTLTRILDRLALALENARLLEDSQKRAAREQTLRQISARVRESLDIDTILKTAIQEIHRSLNLQEAEIRIETVSQDTTIASSKEEKP